MSAAQDEFNELMRDKERRTQHPEDDESDARSFLNLSDEDDDDNDATPPASQFDPDEAPSRPSTSNRPTIPLTRYEANTGPKGVIADAQHFRDSRRQHRVSVRSSSTLASQVQGGLSLHDSPQTSTNEKLQESDEEEEEDTLDDDFMQRWRSSRLREMQRGGRDSKMHSRRPSRRMWGSLATVDGEGYLDAVDKSPADTVVVVYIYDDCVSHLTDGEGVGVHWKLISCSPSPTSAQQSRPVSASSRDDIWTLASSSCTTWTLRWSPRVYRPCWRTAAARSSLAWCRLSMKFRTMRI